MQDIFTGSDGNLKESAKKTKYIYEVVKLINLKAAFKSLTIQEESYRLYKLILFYK